MLAREGRLGLSAISKADNLRSLRSLRSTEEKFCWGLHHVAEGGKSEVRCASTRFSDNPTQAALLEGARLLVRFGARDRATTEQGITCSSP